MSNLLRAAWFALIISAVAGRVSGQSIVTAEITGWVEGSGGVPIPGALVTLRAAGSDAGRVVTAESDGRFVFSFLLPGSYDLVAEALGHRPVVVESFDAEAGKEATIRIRLTVATPPVEGRDTVHEADRPEATVNSLSWLDPGIIRGLPDPGQDLGFLASLTSLNGSGLGFEGLPEHLTAVFVDGQPFRPARYPGSEGDPGRGLILPKGATSQAAVVDGTADVEWADSPGGILAVSNGVARGKAPEIFALGAGAPTWRSSALKTDVPSFSSIWAGMGASLSLIPDTADLHLAFEASRAQRPTRGLVSDSIAGLLDPQTTTARFSPSLNGPYLEDVTRASGSLKLDWSRGKRGALQAEFGGAAFNVDHGGGSAPFPRFATLQGRDGFASANLIINVAPPVALEIRARATLSTRDSSDPTGKALLGPTTNLLDPAVALGGDPGQAGDVRRTEVGGSAILHYLMGPHRLKMGARGGLASHRYDALDDARGTFLFSNAQSAGHDGFFIASTGTAPATSFSVPTVGGFLQYRWTAAPALVLTLGANYDLGTLPTDLIRRDDRWATLTGLANDSVDDRMVTFGGLLHASWDVSGRGTTMVDGGVRIDSGELDPSALHEVIQNSGRLSIKRILGPLPSWPNAPTAGTATTAASLSILSPEMKPPRTTRAVLGIAHRFGNGTALRITGTARRTEFLLRRADLNVPTVEALHLDDGRVALSRPTSVGGLVAPAAGSWRRFPEYDVVWALNADGWSKYSGVTFELERALSASGILFARYTFSQTTDNLVGLTQASRWAKLAPGIDPVAGHPWEEGTSDLDVPHRVSVGAMFQVPRLDAVTVAAIYNFSSGLPFTPKIREGLDVNGDGSWMNDVAFVRDNEEIAGLVGSWKCLATSVGAFPLRNACRGDPVHELDMRVTLRPGALGRVPVEILVDLLNLTDQEDGIRDDALLLLDPNRSATVGASGTLTIPYRVNPGFGTLLTRTDAGRMLRIGLRLGVPQ